MMRKSRSAGFTLIEMIAVLTLSAILGLVVWRNLSLPIRAFVDGARRAELVATGRLALWRISREVRLAVPNSVRTAGSDQALEFLRTSASGRYRASVDPATAGSDALNLTATADTFQLLGQWTLPGDVRTGAGLAACLAGTSDCVAIYNTGNPASCAAQAAGTRTNVWCGDNLAGITSVNATTGIIGVSRSSAGTAWPTGSSRQRFFVVDAAVSFVCSGTELRRYAGYAINAVQPVPPAGTGQLLADHVESCAFSYNAGSSTRSALVTVSLTVADASPGGSTERVTLVEQIHVPNTP
jgi:MSHA biogenesis protein MshO